MNAAARKGRCLPRSHRISRRALVDAATAIEHGGAAGQAGTRVWEAMIREFRGDGELAALVDMARDDGHLDLMLGIGELSPG
jgi:hypothetical protein